MDILSDDCTICNVIFSTEFQRWLLCLAMKLFHSEKYTLPPTAHPLNDHPWRPSMMSLQAEDLQGGHLLSSTVLCPTSWVGKERGGQQGTMEEMRTMGRVSEVSTLSGERCRIWHNASNDRRSWTIPGWEMRGMLFQSPKEQTGVSLEFPQVQPLCFTVIPSFHPYIHHDCKNHHEDMVVVSWLWLHECYSTENICTITLTKRISSWETSCGDKIKNKTIAFRLTAETFLFCRALASSFAHFVWFGHWLRFTVWAFVFVSFCYFVSPYGMLFWHCAVNFFGGPSGPKGVVQIFQINMNKYMMNWLETYFSVPWRSIWAYGLWKH